MIGVSRACAAFPDDLATLGRKAFSSFKYASIHQLSD
jgi:hypothetical protein